MLDLNKLYHMDCMDGMRQFPDKYFDLAIVDPPYGGGAACSKYKVTTKRAGGDWAAKYGDTISHWDIAPQPEYFEELMRVSKNQIIWGGNYFDLPPTRCFIVWDKLNIPETFTMAMCEYAWTSFNSNAKVFGCIPQDVSRFHPTQKPIALYAWQLGLYAQGGYKILDTHAGSASSLVACHNAGLDFVGFEIDDGYYTKAKTRLDAAMAQQTLL